MIRPNLIFSNLHEVKDELMKDWKYSDKVYTTNPLEFILHSSLLLFMGIILIPVFISYRLIYQIAKRTYNK